MDPYEEERLAVEKAAFAAELRMALEEGVARGWWYEEDRENGERAYGLTEEGKRAMERGEPGRDGVGVTVHGPMVTSV